MYHEELEALENYRSQVEYDEDFVDCSDILGYTLPLRAHKYIRNSKNRLSELIGELLKPKKAVVDKNRAMLPLTLRGVKETTVSILSCKSYPVKLPKYGNEWYATTIKDKFINTPKLDTSGLPSCPLCGKSVDWGTQLNHLTQKHDDDYGKYYAVTYSGSRSRDIIP